MNMSDVEKVLISEQEIKEICSRLGAQISKDYEGKKPLLVGLLKGSVPFMAELMKHIDIDMEIDFMKASSYSGTHSTGTVTITRDTTTNMEGRHVLLVEDIVDTGLTLREVKNLLKALKLLRIVGYRSQSCDINNLSKVAVDLSGLVTDITAENLAFNSNLS